MTSPVKDKLGRLLAKRDQVLVRAFIVDIDEGGDVFIVTATGKRYIWVQPEQLEKVAAEIPLPS